MNLRAPRFGVDIVFSCLGCHAHTNTVVAVGTSPTFALSACVYICECKPRPPSSSPRFIFRTCAQARFEGLDTLVKRSRGVRGACDVTKADIEAGIAFARPPNRDTAEQFCSFIFNITAWAETAGCSTIADAGAIPVVFDIVRRWPDDADVLKVACGVVYNLAHYGSSAVIESIHSVSDCESLLRAAAASGLDDTCRCVSALWKLGLLSRTEAMVRALIRDML